MSILKPASMKLAADSPLSILLPYQLGWVQDASRFKIGVWSRQTGKSFSTAAEAARDCIVDKGTMWVCLSAGERQALEWMEKARMWAEAFHLATESYREERDHSEALMKAAEIRWANGSRILAIPANPKTARGYSSNVVLDEFAYHEDPDAIWRAMYPSITNPLKRQFKIRIVSTFNGRGNKFFSLWEGAEKAGYSRHNISIHDAVAQGLPVDVEALREALADPEGWAQEFENVPLDGSNVLLPYELIALAESAEATAAGAPAERAGGRFFAGIDFGRQNDPTVCWLLERVGELLITREVLVLARMDTPDQQEILRSRLALCERASFDYTGPGIGLGDFVAKEFGRWEPEKHNFGTVELCTFSAGFKREIFPKLRRQFEAPVKIRVPIAREIREDLHAMQQTVHNGQYDYWAPRTREGHSDRCTALALAVRAAGEDNGSCGVY